MTEQPHNELQSIVDHLERNVYDESLDEFDLLDDRMDMGDGWYDE
jgi:hypothetical protein